MMLGKSSRVISVWAGMTFIRVRFSLFLFQGGKSNFERFGFEKLVPLADFGIGLVEFRLFPCIIGALLYSMDECIPLEDLACSQHFHSLYENRST